MMNQWIRQLVLAGLCMLAGAAAGHAETLADVHARWYAALESGDPESVRGLFDGDGLIVFSLPDRSWTSTFDEWLSTFASTFEQGYRLSVNDREVQIREAADSGWIFAVQELTWTSSGDPDAVSGWQWHTTEVWERRGDGWKVVHIHHGPAPEQDDSDE